MCVCLKKSILHLNINCFFKWQHTQNSITGYKPFQPQLNSIILSMFRCSKCAKHLSDYWPINACKARISIQISAHLALGALIFLYRHFLILALQKRVIFEIFKSEKLIKFGVFFHRLVAQAQPESSCC